MSFYCILVWGKDCTIWLCPFTGFLVWGKNCAVLALPIYQLLSWGNDFTVLLCTFTCILVWGKDFIVFFYALQKGFHCSGHTLLLASCVGKGFHCFLLMYFGWQVWHPGGQEHPLHPSMPQLDCGLYSTPQEFLWGQAKSLLLWYGRSHV